MAQLDPTREHPSRPQHRMCTRITRITPIPLPADDCDRRHSTHAALSSLGAAAASFDAAMDSLSSTTAGHRRRVRELEFRMTRFRECLRRLDDVASSSKAKDGESLDDRVVVLFCPGSYEDALLGMETGLTGIREKLDSNSNRRREETTETTASENFPGGNLDGRSAADAAVQKALLRDVQMDDGQAVPSDAWLDQASMGLGVGRALEATNEQRSVPLILGEDTLKGELEYQRILDALVLNNASDPPSRYDRLETLEESTVGGFDGRGDDESVYSVTSQMSMASVASSTRMTAGQRRRWHKQQRMRQGARAGGGPRASSARDPAAALPAHPEGPTRAAAGRQQALAGSHPYLCEASHDSYGIGPKPPGGLTGCPGFSGRDGGGGTGFYPPPGNVADLLVFNTARSSYGRARSAAATASKSARGAGEGRGVGPRGRIGVSVPPSPAPSARRTRAGGGAVDDLGLATLVFGSDAAEAKNAGPALDLPVSLPRELSG